MFFSSGLWAQFRVTTRTVNSRTYQIDWACGASLLAISVSKNIKFCCLVFVTYSFTSQNQSLWNYFFVAGVTGGVGASGFGGYSILFLAQNSLNFFISSSFWVSNFSTCCSCWPILLTKLNVSCWEFWCPRIISFLPWAKNSSRLGCCGALISNSPHVVLEQLRPRWNRLYRFHLLLNLYLPCHI